MEPASKTATEGSQDSTRMSSFIDFDGKSGVKGDEERTLAKPTVPLSGAARKAMIDEVGLHVANQPGKILLTQGIDSGDASDAAPACCLQSLHESNQHTFSLAASWPRIAGAASPDADQG
jgi:hypothetical protein